MTVYLNSEAIDEDILIKEIKQVDSSSLLVIRVENLTWQKKYWFQQLTDRLYGSKLHTGGFLILDSEMNLEEISVEKMNEMGWYRSKVKYY